MKTQKNSFSVDLARLTFPFVVFVCLTSLVGGYFQIPWESLRNGSHANNFKLNTIFTLIFFFTNEKPNTDI